MCGYVSHQKILFFDILSASNLPHFCGNPQFLFSLEISVLGFPTSGKKILKKIFFSLKIFFREKKKQKPVPCNDFPQTKWRLNSPAQEEQEIF